MYDNNSSPSLVLSLTLILLCMTNKYGNKSIICVYPSVLLLTVH